MQVLSELGVRNAHDVSAVLSTISVGIPIKKLMLVVEMSMLPDKSLHPGRFTSTLHETGLLTGMP